MRSLTTDFSYFMFRRLSRTSTRPVPRSLSSCSQTSLFLLCVAASSSCTRVQFISDYDEIIDHSTTELQQEIEQFLVAMERQQGTPAGSFTENASFYDQAEADIRVLRVRAGARPKSDLTVQHFDELLANVENLRQLHERRGDDGLTAVIIEPARRALDTQFRAILTLELAKKRGE